MHAWCRTAIVICLLAVWSTVIVFSFGILLAARSIARQKRQIERTTRAIANIYGRGCMFIIAPWVKVRQENLHILKAPCIVVANHLSMLDLTCLSFLPDKNICMLVKSWPSKTPFMGMFVRKASYINTDELTFMQMMQRVEEEIAKKSIIVVFPEGSRSTDGKLQRLRAGAFRLAVSSGLPVYPLRYTGTDKAFPKGRLVLYPATITMRLYDKIWPQQNNPESYDHWAHKRLKRQVRACLQEAA